MKGFAQIIVGILIGVLLMALVVGGYILGKSSTDPKISDVTAAPTVTTIPTKVPAQEIVSNDGSIEGSISFPSEGIPDSLEVCAQNTLTQELTCTKDRITDVKYDYGTGYQLSLTAGSYIVYAHTDQSTYKAYFSEAVECGLNINCTDHTPVVVKVMQNTKLENIDPQDWYDTSQN